MVFSSLLIHWLIVSSGPNNRSHFPPCIQKPGETQLASLFSCHAGWCLDHLQFTALHVIVLTHQLLIFLLPCFFSNQPLLLKQHYSLACLNILFLPCMKHRCLLKTFLSTFIFRVSSVTSWIFIFFMDIFKKRRHCGQFKHDLWAVTWAKSPLTFSEMVPCQVPVSAQDLSVAWDPYLTPWESSHPLGQQKGIQCHWPCYISIAWNTLGKMGGNGMVNTFYQNKYKTKRTERLAY